MFTVVVQHRMIVLHRDYNFDIFILCVFFFLCIFKKKRFANFSISFFPWSSTRSFFENLVDVSRFYYDEGNEKERTDPELFFPLCISSSSTIFLTSVHRKILLQRYPYSPDLFSPLYHSFSCALVAKLRGTKEWHLGMLPYPTTSHVPLCHLLSTIATLGSFLPLCAFTNNCQGKARCRNARIKGIKQ